MYRKAILERVLNSRSLRTAMVTRHVLNGRPLGTAMVTRALGAHMCFRISVAHNAPALKSNPQESSEGQHGGDKRVGIK